MNCVCIKIMLKIESLKTELLKVSPPVPCGVVQHRPHHKEQEETLYLVIHSDCCPDDGLIG
jgi:hypothetical protein